MQQKPMVRGLIALGLIMLAAPSVMAMGVTNSGKSQTYGTVSGEAMLSGVRYNPAAASLAASRMKDKTVAGELSGAGGLEYGDVQNIFDLIDGLEPFLTDSGSGGDGGGNTGGDGGNLIFDGIDIANPELDALIDAVAAEAARLTAVLTLVAAEGYARANLDSQFSMVINKDVAGGTFALDYTGSISSGLLGVVDELGFEPETALTALQNAYNLDTGSPTTRFDLSGGVFLTVQPSDGSVNVEFENDSLLLTRAASIEEFTLSYSREAGDFSSGNLYWGVAPKIVLAGLSNVAFRIGDITDSEGIFDDLRDANFNNETGFGLNAGLMWVADNYSLGATVKDVIAQEFDFPELDTSTFTNPDMIQAVENAGTYKLKTQLSLQGNYTSTNDKWSFNAALDANAVEDILGFEYQWLNLSGGYHTGSWIFPDLRVGYHQNLAGSELGYFAVGFTFLKYVNVDASLSPDSVKIDGTEVPRGGNISIGLNYAF
ncbi:plasmid transfer operon, TraF, protein [Alteromonadaceae bacterium Bs31]|nr:plasmid transfer operon, TraF, protein [Alteromonadaceae bacterium Bs31]